MKNHVIIRLSPEYYVRELDALIDTYVRTNNQDALNGSVGVTWHTIAAMEGDWDNGEDPLEHARTWMGEERFNTFRDKYPDKYQHLLALHRSRQRPQ